MTEEAVESVVKSVQDNLSPEEGYVHNSDSQTAHIVTCMMENREHGEPPWPIEVPWRVFGVETVGNQVREKCGNKTALDSSLLHLTSQHDFTAVVVVGHTDCEAVKDAYEYWVSPSSEPPAGIESRLKPLVSVVDDAFDEGVFEESTPLRAVQSRLVEYNVVRQVSFLEEHIPNSTTTVGYVYDENGVYGSFPDMKYMVALDGRSDPTEIRDRLPEETSVRVASLID